MNNLYRKNSEILKAFFAKPLTLILAFLFILAGAAPLVYFLIDSTSFNITALILPLYMLMPASIFFYLFIRGRNAKEIKSINFPFIMSIILLLILIIEIPVAYFIKEFVQFSLSGIAYGALILISAVITFNSIRKSANEVFLYRKGAVFLGIMCIISAVAVGAFAALFIMFIISFNTHNLGSSVNTILFIIELAVVWMILFICLGIWAFKYSATIKKASVFVLESNKGAKVQSLADANSLPVQEPQDEVYQEPAPEVFKMPEQEGVNPYEKPKDDTPNHINYQNPYAGFVPQNPFEQ